VAYTYHLTPEKNGKNGLKGFPKGLDKKICDSSKRTRFIIGTFGKRMVSDDNRPRERLQNGPSISA